MAGDHPQRVAAHPAHPDAPGFARAWRRDRQFLGVFVGAAALCALVLLLAPAYAHANLEFVTEYPRSNEVQIAAGPAGIAVNDKTGDFYQAEGLLNRVTRYDKDGKFIEAWGWGVHDGKEEFEHCGPGQCPGRDRRGEAVPGEGQGQFQNTYGAAVDQATGNVYVVTNHQVSGVIQEFNANGEFIESFGERGTGGGQQIEKLFNSGGIAVDPSGDVYLVDQGRSTSRVLEFEQVAPGMHVFKREILKNAMFPMSYLALDAKGNFVISNESEIARYSPSNLTTPEWKVAVTEVNAVSVDPETGRVFYFAPKQKTQKFQVLGPEGAARPEEAFEGGPDQTEAAASAFNPSTAHFYANVPFEGTSRRNARGVVFAEPVVHEPVVEDQSVSGLGTTVATLNGVVNPEGLATTYVFEYGTEGPCSTHSCSQAPIGGGGAGSGTTGVPVSVAVNGLSPGTTYYYRVVAKSEFTVAGADESFTTFALPSATRPDDRAYELVSPAEKHGGEVFPIDGAVGSCSECEPGVDVTKMPEQVRPDGEGVVYQGFPFLSEPEGHKGAVNENEYLSTRTSDGWSTVDISPELQTTGQGNGYRGFTADLSAGIVAQREPALAPDALGERTEDLYLSDLDDTFRPLATEPTFEPKFNATLTFEAGSQGFEHIAFAGDAALTPETPFAPPAPVVTGEHKDEGSQDERSLYDWASGEVRLVSVLPGNTAVAHGAVLGSGKLLSQHEAGPDHCGAVSSDGSHIFWTAVATGQVYVREHGESTVEIPDPGTFLCASADGNKVLLNDGHLYDLGDERDLDLSQGQGGFLGLLGAGEDLNRIYFVDQSALAAEEGPGGAKPTAGKDNLYLYEGSTDKTRFIATLSEADNEIGVDFIDGDWAPSPSNRLAQVSADGRYAAFQSRAELTGYDSEPASGKCGREQTRFCAEVFEYDAQAGKLACASCNPTGSRPVGESFLGLLRPVESTFPQPRDLANNGRLYFDSLDRLVGEDQWPGVENVYEREQSGQGSCERQEGCVFLISSGHSKLDSSFFSAGESGRDVFFTTRQQLVPEDQDEMVDLYDAREGGGFATVSSPSPCVGEACRPPGPPGTPPSTPASATFGGLGNAVPPAAATAPVKRKPAPKKCPKRKVRKHGKCVKARHKKHSKASKSRTRSRSAERGHER